jgi:ferredoxin-NADP reductase/mono/diheme cytochrome c family protein
MLSVPISTALGVLFILAGGAAVWLILDSSRRTHDQTARERAIRAHRIAGYLFIALFAFMMYIMASRLGQGSEDLPMRTMLHIGIAVVLLPLLFFKILIARYYRGYTAILAPLGLTIFTFSVLLIISAAGPQALRTLHNDISPQDIATDPDKVDLRAAAGLMQQRCTHCHALERVTAARKDPQGWLQTVKRMRAMPQSDIWESEAKVILSYLLAEQSTGSSAAGEAAAGGKQLVDSYCGRCHSLDRVYQSSKSPAAWRAIMTRMTAYSRGTKSAFSAREGERILEFLSAKQHPQEAPANTVRDAAFSEPSAATSAPEPPEPGGDPLPRPAVAVSAAIALCCGALVWRRPKSPAPQAAATLPAARAPTAVAPKAKSMLLELARIERQTHDSVTLRFRIAGNDGFRARPGQFLSFDWLFDGQKISRCYSISSSPTQAGFVEITVKRQPQGCVSKFLNDRSLPGLTVEAAGPFGQFYFDEKQHKKIAMFAGGSGITPFVSMLRYIDDLCLDTEATLFYTVRTPQDIIFDRELERLEKRLPNFRRVVVATRADSTWHGPTGYLRPELVQRHLGELDSYTCFMCGPLPFMNHVRNVLLSLDVDPQKIHQESFGGGQAAPAKESPAAIEAPAASVEFARSGKTCAVSNNRTLLETAELNGISIPFSCRQGQCGTCATRLLGGQVEMEREDGLQPAQKAQGFILPCMARPQGDVRLDA